MKVQIIRQINENPDYKDYSVLEKKTLVDQRINSYCKTKEPRKTNVFVEKEKKSKNKWVINYS